MNKLCAGILLIWLSTICSAQNPKAPPASEINKLIVRAVTNYASAISCENRKITPRDIAALIPNKTMDDRFDSRYATLWIGDIGCSGGSASMETSIAIATVGAGNSVVVIPMLSSPAIKFDLPVKFVDKIVSNTVDKLVLEGREVGPNDAMCCPSIAVRFTMQADQNGNWKTTEKKIITPKK